MRTFPRRHQGGSHIYSFAPTLHLRTLQEFIKRWVPMIEKRQTYSKLAAFGTQIGPLNQVIHVWPYENALERSKIRAAVVMTRCGCLRPPVHCRDEVGDLSPAHHGAVQRRSYFECAATLAPAAFDMAARWKEHLPGACRR